MEEYFKKILQEIRKFSPELEFIEIGTDLDHVHVHMVIPPKYAVSATIQRIKANTSSRMKGKFPYLSKVYWDSRGIWGTGFFVSTVGIDEQTIRNYVRQQGEHDAGQLMLEL